MQRELEFQHGVYWLWSVFKDGEVLFADCVWVCVYVCVYVCVCVCMCVCVCVCALCSVTDLPGRDIFWRLL